MISKDHFLAYRRLGFGLILLLTLSICIPGTVSAQAPPPVPTEYQDLYTSLTNYLNSFNATLNASWNGAPSPVVFSSTLVFADGNAGSQLINPGYYNGIVNQLQALKAMGVQAVTVPVEFPILYQPFFTNPSDYQLYYNFYQQVAASARALGMKVIVENNILLSGGLRAGWNTAPFYASLNWTQYQQARAQCAVAVAQAMQPDYLVVVEEPDTEASQTGQSQANTVAGSDSLLSTILTALQQSGVTGVKYGAGVGTWMNGYDQYIQSYVSMPVDFIDFHVYPINNGFLTNSLTVASIAASAGKPVSMTEAWMWKVRDSELNVLTPDQIMSRNAYSFWAPLDTAYMQTMENLAYYTNMAFLTPEASYYYWTYQDYNAVQNWTASQLWTQTVQLTSQANQQALYTSTGMAYYNFLVNPPDTAPPSTPGNLTGVSGSPTGAALSWNASTDNVGVAGYYVYRNGVNVATTASTIYQDTGLTGATTYPYYVVAFDLGGNVSPPSLTVNVTTQDLTPPTAPPSVTATATTTTQINVTWAAATDDLAIGSYRVFQGTSPSNLVQIALTPATTFSYTSYSLTPNTTYYYAVQAGDTSGNLSPMSVIVSATTLALPSTPGALAATASSTSTFQIILAWGASTSGMPLAGYQIFRGTSSSNMAQIGTVATTSYTDIGLSAGTQYFYGVRAIDSGGNLSPMSNTANATTLALPSAPTAVSGTATVTQITLGWLAGPAGLPIGSYRVFRGTSVSGMVQIATVTKTSFIDSGLTGNTTYYYGVQEADTGGNISPMSPATPVTTLALPSTPSNLVATASTTSTGQIILTWSASTSGLPLTGYRIYRGSSPSNLSQLATVSPTSYTDIGLTGGTQYCYGVQAIDTGGNVSGMSTTACATTLALPSAPTSVTAKANSPSQVTVTWIPGPSGLPVNVYGVFRGTSPSNLVQVASTKNTSFTDNSLSPSTYYYYAVQESDTIGNISPLSAPPVSVLTLGPPQPPVSVTAVPTSTSKISVSWVAGASTLPVTSYRIFRSTSPSGLTQIATRSASPYSDSSLTPSTTYYYGVEEVDSSGAVSPMSQIVQVTTPALPSPPTNVVATPTSTKQVSLTWVAGPSGLTVKSYKVFRGTTSTNLSQVGTATATTYTDKSLSPATTYYYGVEEVDTAGDVSAMSQIAAAKTLAPPSAPVGVTVTASSTKQMVVTWTAGSSGVPVANYQVFRGSSPSNLSQVTSTTKTSYTDNSVSPSTTYCYAVQETDTDGNVSPKSAAVCATSLALPSPPTNVTGTAVSKTQISLTWTTAQSGMSIRSYNVYRGSTASNLAQYKTAAATATSFTDFSLTAGTTYYYAVQTVDTGGNQSALSNVVAVTTLN